jgi:hypothetical protein
VPHTSADGPGKAYPAERSPVTAYKRLFGNLLSTSGVPVEQVLAENRSLLDFMQTDIDKTMRRLSGAERMKLEQYLESVRSMEAGLSKLGDVKDACSKAPAPDAKVHNLQVSRGPVMPDVIRAHIDVAFNALQCGLTRVAAISVFGGSAAHNIYETLGDTKGHHQQCHDRNDNMIAAIDTFIASQVAYMRQRLQAVPEGNGTMADNTLIMWLNTGGGWHHHGWENHAVVLLGSAGGYFRTGRFLLHPVGKHCISDLFVSVANAMGVPITTFGDPMYCKGPLPNLV